jgi:hypothetical protein
MTPTFIPMSSWPMLILVLFKALIASTLLTPHIASSPFTCLDSILYTPHPHDPERIQHGVFTCHPLLHPPPTLSNF